MLQEGQALQGLSEVEEKEVVVAVSAGECTADLINVKA